MDRLSPTSELFECDKARALEYLSWWRRLYLRALGNIGLEVWEIGFLEVDSEKRVCLSCIQMKAGKLRVNVAVVRENGNCVFYWFSKGSGSACCFGFSLSGLGVAPFLALSFRER
jgi:hypothetical protein